MDIKASDLRRGNLLTLSHDQRREMWFNEIQATNDYFKVLSIFDDKEICLELDDESVDMEIKDTEPIPLSYQILKINIGFTDKDYKKGYIGLEYKSNMILDFVLTKPFKMGEWQNYYVYELLENRFVKIEYLHELQNLFHSLTGKELEIKNPPAKDQEG